MEFLLVMMELNKSKLLIWTNQLVKMLKLFSVKKLQKISTKTKLKMSKMEKRAKHKAMPSACRAVMSKT